MNRMFALLMAAVMLSLPGQGAANPAVMASAKATDEAALRTATFTVENMTCAACPITVRTAMKRVKGVKSVDVDFAARTATVVFDPAVTTAEAIAEASANAGYPATPLDGEASS